MNSSNAEIMRPWMWGGRPAAQEQIEFAFRQLVHIARTGQPAPGAVATEAPLIAGPRGTLQ